MQYLFFDITIYRNTFLGPQYPALLMSWAKRKRGLMVIFEILGRDISLFEYYKSFHWFFAYVLDNKCNGISLNHLRRMFDIYYCDVIYYVIYVICSHYVSKAISPLFAWPSSVASSSENIVNAMWDWNKIAQGYIMFWKFNIFVVTLYIGKLLHIFIIHWLRGRQTSPPP